MDDLIPVIKQGFSEIAYAVASNSKYSMLLTIVSGVIVFVLCECIKEIWLEPLQEYKRLRQKTAKMLTLYANYYCNVIDLADATDAQIKKYDEAGKSLRELAADVEGFIECLSWFKPGIPAKKDLYRLSKEIICLSNSMFCAFDTHEYHVDSKMNKDQADAIRQIMKLYSQEYQRKYGEKQ